MVINDEDSGWHFRLRYARCGEAGRAAARNRQHIVIAEACPFNTGEALINLGREPEISTSGTGWERLPARKARAAELLLKCF